MSDRKIGIGTLYKKAADIQGLTTKESARVLAQQVDEEMGLPPMGSDHVPTFSEAIFEKDGEEAQTVRGGVDSSDDGLVQWNPVNKQGQPIPGYSNVMLFLRQHLRGTILRLNEMTEQLETGTGPIDENMISAIIAILETTSGVGRWSRECVTASIGRLAAESPKYHPVRAYLKGLAWDGVERIGSMVGGPIKSQREDHMHTVYLTKFLLSAVARAMKPGCKSDLVLILQGPQGARKSTFFNELVPNPSWFDDTSHNVDDKDASLAVSRAWIMEWSELESVKRSSKGAVKAFLTRRIDRYRPPYGRAIVEKPRASVIVGSTNEDQFLADETGNRRFMLLPVDSLDIDWVVANRDQVWAEAVYRWASGEPHWLETQDMVKAQEERNKVAEHGDPWEDQIAQWLDSHVSFDSRVGRYTTVRCITNDCLELHAAQVNKAVQMRVADCLKSIGYARTANKIVVPEGYVRVFRIPSSSPEVG